MWMALMAVTPVVSVGSVQAAAVSPLRMRAALIAVRSSVTCAAFMTVWPATSGSSVKVLESTANVALTTRAALIVTLQAPLPAQLPLQPVKVEPAAGTAVRVTAVLLVNEAEHVVPHEIPSGALVTVPLPMPAFVTVSAKDDKANVAVTLWAALIVTVQGLVVLVQPPLQPVNVEPAVGVAVNVTAVPLSNGAEQVVPQERPTGLLVTVPLPAPALETVKVELVDAPVPLTSRETVSPSVVKLTLVLATAVRVGVNRTVTVAVA